MNEFKDRHANDPAEVWLYVVIATLPADGKALLDIVAAARRHAFMVVLPTHSCDARSTSRHSVLGRGVLLEADLAHAIGRAAPAASAPQRSQSLHPR